ncbi:MAG: Gfo/Idh/MocA family oxidoreductase [Pirellula sp.]|jgi:predicted dehydrogenase|nr:Gfo/Idh/MocA family oxidoreductase [Pirellula sp.]
MMPLHQEECRWGILSTAAIAKKNWRAIAKTRIGRVAGVASRDVASAEAFIRECQASCPQKSSPKAYGSYQALLEDPQIDAVYIPLPTALRKEWILKAARHGKHVLAEKPSALTAHELEEVLEECRKHNVQYMDGVMFMHSGRLPKLRNVLDDSERIGNVRRIATHFSFYGDENFRSQNIRSNSLYEPHGCLGDLGWYNIRFILWANGWREPTKVTATCLSTIQGKGSPKPVPSELSAELWFDNGVSASFYCSFITQNQQWVHISGDRGCVWIDDFVLPFYGSEVGFDVQRPEFLVEGCDFHMHRRSERVSLAEYAAGFPGAQEVNMFEDFHTALRGDKPDPQWGAMTMATQRVIDAAFQAAGFSHS